VRQKVKIIDHGNTWIDTSMPKVCPECASLNVKKNTFQNSGWHGPFKVKSIKYEFYCRDCKCRFSTNKEKRHIVDVCWEELPGYIALITFVISFILSIIIGVLVETDKEIPILLLVAMFSSFGVCIISFIAFVANN
jgi:ABC-type dipeptide/oligopeptide/nickel transport system permease component